MKWLIRIIEALIVVALFCGVCAGIAFILAYMTEML